VQLAIDKDKKTLTLRLVKSPLEGAVPAPEIDEIKYLHIINNIEGQYQEQFVKDLAKLLKEQDKNNDKIKSYYEFSGFNKDIDEKEFGMSFIRFNTETKEGTVLFSEFSQSTGNFNYIEVDKIYHELDKKIIPSRFTAIKPPTSKDKTYDGFTLGQSIELAWDSEEKEPDLGRMEATVFIPGENSTEIKARTRTYSPVSTMSVLPSSTGKKTIRKLSVLHGTTVKVGIATATTLFLTEDKTNKASLEKRKKYRVSAIKVTSNAEGIKGLCGDEKLTIKIGTKTSEVKSLIDKALKKNKLEDSAYYFIPEDPDGNNEIRTMYFPNENMILSFVDRELVSATIYESK